MDLGGGIRRAAGYVRRFRVRHVWARIVHRRRFKEIRTFCLFVGYPRSGHSIVGAMLNAHRDAVISNEADAPVHILAGCSRNGLFARILAVASWFHARGNRNIYSYAVPKINGRAATPHCK